MASLLTPWVDFFSSLLGDLFLIYRFAVIFSNSSHDRLKKNAFLPNACKTFLLSSPFHFSTYLSNWLILEFHVYCSIILNVYCEMWCKINYSSIEWPWNPCWKSNDCNNLDLFLDSQFCSVVVYIYIYANTTLFWLWLHTSAVSFEIRKYESSLFFFFNVALVIQGPLHFHMNFSSSLSISEKEASKILIRILLNLWINLGNIAILAVLNISIHKCGRCFHIVWSLIYFNNIL